ncbi:hypothetical protein GGR50DRAFT_666929 [Xylaria sp. CBS 124048]|nr:hypothetical protein GGR50DRAFT_666929 [Xylaria sp. CBS 124048]
MIDSRDHDSLGINQGTYINSFAGAMLPLFDPMFDGAPMVRSHLNNMESFIDSILADSIDP